MNSRLWWGILLVTVGLVLVLDNIGVWEIGVVLRDWWPALLIVLGFAMLLGRRSPVRPVAPWPDDLPSSRDPAAPPGGDVLKSSSVIGETSQRVSSRNFKGGNVSTVFGDTFIDCSSAAVADGEHSLRVNGVFGNLRVRLPNGVSCSVTASTLLGSVRLCGKVTEGFSPSATYETPGFAEARARLRIQLSLVAGDVEVDQ